MRISIIVAMAEGGVIGLEGGMPWHISADLKHFKAVTMGKPIVMGRKTYESIGRALPGRSNILVTRQADYEAKNVIVAGSMDVALEAAGDVEEVMIIGGAEIYRAALPRAARIYLTEVASAPEGDVYFPRFNRDEWQETAREDFPAVGDAPAYSFVVLERE
jgi:dihydrofolate reductase